jgi:hypothetical protein
MTKWSSDHLKYPYTWKLASLQSIIPSQILPSIQMHQHIGHLKYSQGYKCINVPIMPQTQHPLTIQLQNDPRIISNTYRHVIPWIIWSTCMHTNEKILIRLKLCNWNNIKKSIMTFIMLVTGGYYISGHPHWHKDHGILGLICCEWPTLTTNLGWEWRRLYNHKTYFKTRKYMCIELLVFWTSTNT